MYKLCNFIMIIALESTTILSDWYIIILRH